MSLAAKLLSASGGLGSKLYVDEVFSAYAYTGNGATQTIVNGINLSTNGGMVWTKIREPNGGEENHRLYDTTRGVGNSLQSNSTAAQDNQGNSLTAFGSNGYTLGGLYLGTNGSPYKYVSWTFRKDTKFFDVVTYTGNGANRTIAHSLGQPPGMIVVKRTDVASEWKVYHTSLANTAFLALNTTAASATDATLWNSTTATSSVFSIGTHADVNTNTATYVAYVFAHDTSADGLIRCGSFTTDASGNATVTLGWEPQFVMIKNATGVSFAAWSTMDQARALGADALQTLVLYANSSASEVGASYGSVFATGFNATGQASQTYIYLAIRRPNKPPTAGTQVYNAIARTGTSAAATVTGVGFAPDLVMCKDRSLGGGTAAIDRLRGSKQEVNLSTIDPESTQAVTLTNFTMDGEVLGADGTTQRWNISADTYIVWHFKRAPGFFDEICYTGTGANKTEVHNLGVAPELWILKSRSGSTAGIVGCSLLANTDYAALNSAAGKVTDATAWNSTYPAASLLSLGTLANVNTNAGTYVAHLFATLANISKVFSYTGNGTSQTIACGFTTGARFVLIKRTDAAGDWFVWDTVRGIVAATDPHLSLNSSVAEVTTNDSIDPATSGFIVNQDAATNINVSAGTYIGLAIA